MSMPTTNTNSKSFERAMTLAALSGLKIALGPAFLRTSTNHPGSRNWVVAAMGEMLLDKLGVFPARFRPGLLLPHALAGAWVARESLREDGVDDPWAAATGAVVAAGVASVVPMVRIAAHRILGVHDVILGVAEDYLALQAGSRAMGVSMDRITHEAREAVGGLSEQARPALQSVGVNV